MYAFIFVAIIVVERSSNYNRYSLDVLIERKLNGWKHLAEFYDETSSSKRMDGLQTAYKTILPKVDPLVEDVRMIYLQKTVHPIHAHQAAVTNFFAV
jgi:hypothetical protein